MKIKAKKLIQIISEYQKLKQALFDISDLASSVCGLSDAQARALEVLKEVEEDSSIAIYTSLSSKHRKMFNEKVNEANDYRANIQQDS